MMMAPSPLSWTHAMVGGDPGGTNGSSQYFHREFIDAMTGEGIYPLGEVNDDSMMDVIWAINYGANRWCYYELNLFGDPAMHLWTDLTGRAQRLASERHGCRSARRRCDGDRREPRTGRRRRRDRLLR